MQQHLGQFGDRRRQKGGPIFLARLMEVGPSGARIRPLGGTARARFGSVDFCTIPMSRRRK